MDTNKINRDLYNELVKSMSIGQVCLGHLNLNRFEFQEGQQMSVGINFSIDNFELERNKITIFPKIKVEFKDEKGSNIVAEIECLYLLEYESKLISDIDEVYLQIFIGNTVQHTIWPYMRETIGSITAKMGYPPFVMPIYVRE